jgi:hypothetical protein
MGGAISNSVHLLNSLALVTAVLGDERSVVRSVEGQSFHLSCLPPSFGGGYLLSSFPDTQGHTISFEIAPDGVMRGSSATVEYKGLTSEEAKPTEPQMLAILRAMQDTRRP